MTTLTPAELDAIRARCEAATAADARDCGCGSMYCRECRAIDLFEMTAFADIPALLAHVDVLEAALELAVDWLPYHDPTHPDYPGEIADAGRACRAALSPAPPATEASPDPPA